VSGRVGVCACSMRRVGEVARSIKRVGECACSILFVPPPVGRR
jgi:hypothetical protein